LPGCIITFEERGEVTLRDVPVEPSTLAFFATGLALLAFLGWQRRGSVQLKAA